MSAMTPVHLQLLRRLAIHDPGAVSLVMSGRAIEPALIDDRTRALVMLAGTVASQPREVTFHAAVDAALAAGATDSDIRRVVELAAEVADVGHDTQRSAPPQAGSR